MCAIFGIIGKYDKKQAYAAFGKLSHRGVDASHVLEERHCFVGVHRLAITDIAVPMNQPLCLEGVTLVLNGEIYNYEDLAEELGVQSKSDTVVVLYAYKKWGDDFVHHLRGMFAIGILDRETVKLFRDPFGKKPLYYTCNNERFVFASEMKAIHVLKPLLFDRQILAQYLSYQSPVSPDTFDAECFQVAAGCSIVWNKKSKELTEHKFYTPLATSITLHTKEEATQNIEEKLLASVALRLPKEVRCAALLSGGLDSSLIAAMASRHQPIDTFCIGYEGHENYDERPFAQKVAEHIGSVHHEVTFSKEDFLHSIEEVVALLDEPLGDPAMLPLYHLMKEVNKKGIKVVLTGDGSDELFMGYKTYKEFYDLEKASELQFKNWLRNYFKAHFSMHKEWEWYKRIFEGTTLFRSSAEVFTDLQQNRLLRMNIRDNRSLEAIAQYKDEFDKSERSSPIDWYSFLDLKVMLGEVFLRKLDRMSMAHSIEARSPFLDKEVVAAAFSCEPDLRRGEMPKELIKIIAKSYLPKDIIERKKKGFNYPFMQWLQESGELETIERVQQKMNLFNNEELNVLLTQGKQGMFKQHIFSLYMLCKWLEKEGL